MLIMGIFRIVLLRVISPISFDLYYSNTNYVNYSFQTLIFRTPVDIFGDMHGIYVLCVCNPLNIHMH